jgi:PIN domain nuclease of toxin-antitoxin system
MNVLLDTCAILFLSLDDPCVGPGTRAILEGAERVSISPISAAELACLQERARIELPKHWRLWLREALKRNGWDTLPITLEIMEEAWCLPGTFHADPADRILTATARKEDRLLLTTDHKIRDYPHVRADW